MLKTELAGPDHVTPTGANSWVVSEHTAQPPTTQYACSAAVGVYDYLDELCKALLEALDEIKQEIDVGA